MKKTLRRAVIAAAVLVLAGTVAAISAGDSLISLSYLTGTYLPTVVAQGNAATDSKLTQAFDTAQKKLEELNQGFLTGLGAGGSTYSADLRQRDMVRGEQVELPTGSGLILLSGGAAVTHGGVVIDVTTGQEVPSGAALTAAHRYLVGEDTTAVVTVRSGIAGLGVQGYYTHKKSEEKAAPFTDVFSGDWYCAAVDYAYFNNLFSGTGTNTFSPGAAMNRSMIVTVFYHMAGAPKAELDAAPAVFADVPPDQWYAPFVNWAAAKGVTSGTGSGTFSPNQPVTRRQVVALLYSFAGSYLKLDLADRTDLSVYEDAALVSDWGGDAMSWAVAAGLLSSTDSGRLVLSPNQSATRAQVAVILKNFSEKFL